MCMRSKAFSVGKLLLHSYDPWECKECTHVHSSSMIWGCNLGGSGGWKLFLLKNYGR